MGREKEWSREERNRKWRLSKVSQGNLEWGIQHRFGVCAWYTYYRVRYNKAAVPSWDGNDP